MRAPSTAGPHAQIVKQLEATGADYRIAVTTTDIGGSPSPGGTFPGGRTIPGCTTYVGDDGRMQNTSCTQRVNGSAESLNACASLGPDPKFVPSNGARYIKKKGGVYSVQRAAITAACTSGAQDCYCIEPNPKCTAGRACVLRKGGALPPAGQFTKLRCAVP